MGWPEPCLDRTGERMAVLSKFGDTPRRPWGPGVHGLGEGGGGKCYQRRIIKG